MKPILFIHPRRGLFQLTSCQSCHYKFGCDNCDCNLTTYRTFESNMQLLCHQCQNYYTYPKVCPMCKNNEIGSNFGGVDELIEVLKKDFKKEVIKVESKNIIDYEPGVVYVTTRIFDPSLEYNKFSKIIFVHAENLLASPDYLVNEDVHRSLAELFLKIDETTEVVFDTSNPDLPFFVELAKLNSSKGESETYSESFDEDFIDEDNVTASPSLRQSHAEVTATTVSPQEVKGNKTLKLSNPPDGIFRLSCRGSDLGDPDLHFSLAQDDNKRVTAMPTLPPNKTLNIITWYTDFVEEESKILYY
jgi:hypothetical protein